MSLSVTIVTQERTVLERDDVERLIVPTIDVPVDLGWYGLSGGGSTAGAAKKPDIPLASISINMSSWTSAFTSTMVLAG